MTAVAAIRRPLQRREYYARAPGVGLTNAEADAGRDLRHRPHAHGAGDTVHAAHTPRSVRRDPDGSGVQTADVSYER